MQAFISSERAWRSRGSQFDKLNSAGTHLTRFFAESPYGVERGLVQLYHLQDEDEKRAGMSSRLNGRGFGKQTAARASTLALQIIAGGSLSARDMTFASTVVNDHRDQFYKFLNSQVRYEIFTGDGSECGHADAIKMLDAPSIPNKRAAPRPRAPPSKSQRIDSSEDDDEEDEEEEEDEAYEAEEEEEELLPPAPPPSPRRDEDASGIFITRSIMKYIASNPEAPAESLATQLSSMRVSLAAADVHQIRFVSSIFKLTATDFTNGDIFFFKLKGEPWREASVIRTNVNGEYAGVVRAMVNGSEQLLNLDEAAYYC